MADDIFFRCLPLPLLTMQHIFIYILLVSGAVRHHVIKDGVIQTWEGRREKKSRRLAQKQKHRRQTSFMSFSGDKNRDNKEIMSETHTAILDNEQFAIIQLCLKSVNVCMYVCLCAWVSQKNPESS